MAAKNKQHAFEALKRFAVQFRDMLDLAEEFAVVDSLEVHIAQLTSRLDALKADETAARGMIAGAESTAATIVSEAKKRAAENVKAQQARADGIAAEVAKIIREANEDVNIVKETARRESNATRELARVDAENVNIAARNAATQRCAAVETELDDLFKAIEDAKNELAGIKAAIEQQSISHAGIVQAVKTHKEEHERVQREHQEFLKRIGAQK